MDDERVSGAAAGQERTHEYLQALERMAAEFGGYKKKAREERVLAEAAVAKRLLLEMIGVLDNFDRAVAARPNTDMSKAVAEWSRGIELIDMQLREVLRQEQVTVMEMDPPIFDPNLHEAIATEVRPDLAAGTITAILEKGYIWKNSVLRPARVKVVVTPPRTERWDNPQSGRERKVFGSG